ncbi:MAG: DNA polymerase III subunit gamma/tau [Myxococcota bacterium]|nr:DNA polymerase III subunit gamma/tau [Myxococcota bacterium]
MLEALASSEREPPLSYQVIARKWRPQSFDDVIGQAHVTTPLRNAIRSDRIPHALLFSGPRGVGKTTLARILARCLNCEKGPTDEPCGTCDSCTEIISGRSIDVQEIDAASRTGVDDIREVIESIRYAPSPGKYRIFVIDEVHMLSKQAFNALLKTLEEPPPRSLFVFATTNPESIPFTVLSRCQRYDLRRISAQEVARCLGEIAKAEGVNISKQSLLSLAREGDGSMRDSQTLLDQVISYGGTEVKDEIVGQVLDLIDRRVLIAIVRACVESNPKAALEACALAGEKGSDPKRLGASLIQLFRDLVVLSIAPDASGELVDGSPEDVGEIIELAGQSNTQRLRRMFRTLVSEQEDLAWAPQPFAVLEMAIVRIASLPEGGDVAQLVARLDALDKKLASGGGGAGSGGAGGSAGPASGSAGPVGGGGPAGGRSATSASAPAMATAEMTQVAPSPAVRAVSSEAQTAPVQRISGADTAKTTDIDDNPANGDESPVADSMATPEAVLDRVRSLAREQNQPLFHSLDAVRITERTANSLNFAASSDFHMRRLEDRRSELENLCQRFFGKPMRIDITQASASEKKNGTAAVADDRELDRQRRQAALNHPSINLVLKKMRGEIIEIHALDGAKGNLR